MTGTDLASFVTARLNERETLARAALDEDVEANTSREAWLFLAASRPGHVLCEVAAMRAIVAEYEAGQSHPAVAAFHRTLRHLSGIWHEHPDYCPAWAPLPA